MRKLFIGYESGLKCKLGELTSCNVIQVDITKEEAIERAIKGRKLIDKIDALWDREGLRGRG